MAAGLEERWRLAAWPLELKTILLTLVLMALGFLVLYPLTLLLINSFQISRPGQPPIWSLAGWEAAVGQPGMQKALVNTLTLAMTRTGIGMGIAILVAWVLARTNIPGKHVLEVGFWVAFFLPTVPVVLAWILLLDPQFGLVNQFIVNILGTANGPFDIYSWWGIVWVHLMTNTIAVKVILLLPAFRNMDAALEEASLVSGSSNLGTMIRILVPIMTPAILLVVLLSTIRALEAFEIELILGLPVRIDVYSTVIYRLVRQEPAEYGPATALGVIMLGVMVPLIVLQQWAGSRRHYTTISGRYRIGLVQLGPWRMPVFLLVVALVGLLTIVPAIFLGMGTVMRLFGFFSLESPWTDRHWRVVLSDPAFLASVRNTVVIAGGTALGAAFVYSVIAYVVVRTRFWGRKALDFLTWVPFALPGVLLSLGYLWMFLGVAAFRPLYGSHLILILVLMLSGMTLGVQLVRTTLLQLGNELEEASWIAGGSWWYTYRRVILPLLSPVLLTVGMIAFVNATRSIAPVVLLATSANRPLSLLQLDFTTEGRYEAASVVGVIIVVLTVAVILFARRFGLSMRAN